MKVAVAQINTTIGDFDGNKRKIIDRIKWGRKNGADIVVFPELAVTGYPPKDLVDETWFIAKNLESLEEIAGYSDSGTAVVLGVISVNEASTGKGLFNSAAFLHEGRIKYIQHKTLLPTYDVFDEARYFEPGNKHEVIPFKGRKFGITVCEDIWSTAELYGRKLYEIDPVQILVDKGAEFIINLSSSPYIVGKGDFRAHLLSNVAGQHKLPIIYVNLVGGNDELIFDGRSLVVDGSGRVVHEGNAFVEDAFIVDMANLPSVPKIEKLEPVEEVYEALVLGLRDYMIKSGFGKVVIGLSGGIDSALVACIAADAVGKENVLGICMPTRFSSEESVRLSEKLAENLNICFKVINIDGIFGEYLELLEPHFEGKSPDVTEENIQARIRGNIIMAFSNKFGAIMLSTGNKSELAVGYCTLYGDLAGGLAIISDVPKSMVYELAAFVNCEREIIPPRILERVPTAELRANQTDQDELPPYDVLDSVLKAYIEERLTIEGIVDQGFERGMVEKVIKMVDRSEYKRKQAPPGLKVTSKAFGWGRRYPIACKY